MRAKIVNFSLPHDHKVSHMTPCALCKKEKAGSLRIRPREAMKGLVAKS